MNLGVRVAFKLRVHRGLVSWNQGAWGKRTVVGVVKWAVYIEGIMASEG